MQLETHTIYLQEVTRQLKEVVMRGTNKLVKLVTQAFDMASPTIYHIVYSSTNSLANTREIGKYRLH